MDGRGKFYCKEKREYQEREGKKCLREREGTCETGVLLTVKSREGSKQ